MMDYKMLEDGDRVAVAVSGGKDSASLLKILNERRRLCRFATTWLRSTLTWAIAVRRRSRWHATARRRASPTIRSRRISSQPPRARKDYLFLVRLEPQEGVVCGRG